MTSDFFIIEELVDFNENNSFSLVDDAVNNVATVVIKDKDIKVYFEDDDILEFGSNFNELVKWVEAKGLRFIKLLNGNHRWHRYNPNPKSRNTGDCTLRAYTVAFSISWDEAFDIASKVAKEEGYIPDASPIVKKILLNRFGCTIDEEYKKSKKNDKMTVNEFAMTHPYGTYLLSTHGHLLTVKNGEYYDSWDSGDKKILTIYNVPKSK